MEDVYTSLIQSCRDHGLRPRRHTALQVLRFLVRRRYTR